MIDISNKILTHLKANLTDAKVTAEYPQGKTMTFPLVTIREISNDTYEDTVSSKGEVHSSVSFEINIYSNSRNKISDVKKIRNNVDNIMSGTYNMNRNISTEVPNYADINVYRWMLRYSCVVDENLKIYRR